MMIVRVFVLPLVLTLLTLVFRLAAIGDLNGHPLLIIFVPALLVAGIVGGPWAGLIATLVAWWGAVAFLLPSVWSETELVEQTALVLVGLILTVRRWMTWRQQTRALPMPWDTWPPDVP